MKTPKELQEERLQKEFRDLNKIRPKDVAPLPPTGGVQGQNPERIQSKERQAQNAIEELIKELLRRRGEEEKEGDSKKKNLIKIKILNYNRLCILK